LGVLVLKHKVGRDGLEFSKIGNVPTMY